MTVYPLETERVLDETLSNKQESIIFLRTCHDWSNKLLASHHRVPLSSTGQPQWHLWWTSTDTDLFSSTFDSPVSIIPPLLHIHNFIHCRRKRLLAVDSSFKWNTSVYWKEWRLWRAGFVLHTKMHKLNTWFIFLYFVDRASRSDSG